MQNQKEVCHIENICFLAFFLLIFHLCFSYREKWKHGCIHAMSPFISVVFTGFSDAQRTYTHIFNPQTFFTASNEALFENMLILLRIVSMNV